MVSGSIPGFVNKEGLGVHCALSCTLIINEPTKRKNISLNIIAKYCIIKNTHKSLGLLTLDKSPKY